MTVPQPVIASPCLLGIDLYMYAAMLSHVQEVTPESFQDDFAPFFKKLGYKQGLFQPKKHPQGSEQARKEMSRLLATKKGRAGRFQHSVLGTGT